MLFIFFFFFNDTATTEIYTLSLHDALPISSHAPHRLRGRSRGDAPTVGEHDVPRAERGELEGDRRAHGAGARYDDSSHSSSSRFSLSLKRRNGARTSSRTGTPRRPSTYFAAAWKG